MMILISGASGFIGKNLVERLKNTISVSVRKPNWEIAFGNRDLDAIINLVGKAHDHKSEGTEDDYIYANIDLTKKIFHEFLSSSAKIMIHISSLAALEEFESSIPLDEQCKCNPKSIYGKSKRAAEEWLMSQPIPNNKKLVILRPPMVHGPGDKGNLFLLYRLISKGVPYPLSSFDNKRSFISISNFTFFIQQIIEKKQLLNSGIYHIADDQNLSTNEIIEVIKNVTGKNVVDFKLPKIFVRLCAKFGDIIPIPLNTIRLRKMTSDLIVSNKKIKQALKIDTLPYSAITGLEDTINSFKHKN